MTYDLNNKKEVFVGSVTARSANKTTVNDLVDGEVALCTPAGNLLMGNVGGSGGYAIASGYETIHIVANKGGQLYYSTPMKYGKVTKYTCTAYSAPVQQITYIGYNGTSGQIENNTNIVSGVNYSIKLRRLDNLRGTHDPYFYNKTSSFYSGDATTTTEEAVATGLYEAMAVDFSGTIDGFVKAELIYSGTATVLGNSATLAVVNGSNVVTANAGSHNVVVGSYLRIGGTGVTTPVYRVTAVATNTFTLSTIYTGTTATVSNANSLIINDPTLSTYHWGIKITTIAKLFSVGRFYFDVFKFSVWLGTSFVNTDVTYDTVSSKGNGAPQEVIEMEWQAEHSQRMGKSEYDYPPTTFSGTASTSYTYNITALHVETDNDMFTTSKQTQYTDIIIATQAGATGNEQANSNSATYPVGVVKGLDYWFKDNNGGTDPNQVAHAS